MYGFSASLRGGQRAVDHLDDAMQSVVVHKAKLWIQPSTTIESRKFRIPSDLRRRPGYRPVSSKVGDHLRILLGVVVHSFLPSGTSFMYCMTPSWLV